MFKDPRSLFVATPSSKGGWIHHITSNPALSHLWGRCAGAVTLAIQRDGCA